MINIEYLQKAINDFEEELQAFCEENISISKKERKYKMLRKSVIASFNLCVDISRKLCKKFLKEHYDISNDKLSSKNIMRYAGEYSLINNVSAWIEYINMRNETTHEYIPEEDEEKLEKIISIFDRFLLDLKYLENKLIDYNKIL